MLFKIFKVLLGKKKTPYYIPLPSGTTQGNPASDVVYNTYEDANATCEHLNTIN